MICKTVVGRSGAAIMVGIAIDPPGVTAAAADELPDGVKWFPLYSIT